MKERPIIFSADSVQAILAGRKTQTRRVVRFPFCKSVTHNNLEHVGMKAVYTMKAGGYVFWSAPVGQAESDRLYGDEDGGLRCPYGDAGDRLWVRETWRTEELVSGLDGVRFKADKAFQEIENTPEASQLWMNAHSSDFREWHPSIYMPRWASRIILEITNIRVERLQDITEADAEAEGATCFPTNPAALLCRTVFIDAWNRINAKRGYHWQSNPWVWAIDFKRA